MHDNILRFIGQVFDHWLSAWGGIALMVIAMIEAWRDKKLPKRLFFGAAVSCLFVAMFQAWHDEYSSTEWRGREIVRLSADNARLQQVPLVQNQITTKPKEPKDSLRRRTFSLAKEVYDWAVERAAHSPPFAGPNSNEPNPSEERKREIKTWQDYARETENQYKERYRDRLVGIVKEYETKGVPVHWLVNDFQQRVPSIAFPGSSWEGSPMDELYQFKELAYHVDERDHLIVLH